MKTRGTSQDRPRPRRRGRRIGFRIGGIALVAGLVLASCNATLQGTTLHVVSAQEDSFFSNGDEPYVAVIQFRVIPGVVNSTQVHYLGHLQEIGTHMYDGDNATIPAAMGAMSFPNVRIANAQQIFSGTAPEIVGAVTVAIESDASPFSAIDSIMNNVAAELNTQLRAQIETMSFADLLNTEAASARLKLAADRVKAASEPSFWDSVGIFLSSFGDPDDVIGFKVIFTVAVSADLADALDAQFASGLPTDVVGRALRGSGGVDVTYVGDDANYQVHWAMNVS